MERAQNLAALETVLESMRTQQPDSQGMDHLRRAAYLHTIVAAMLGEQVACLPDTALVYS